MQKITIIGRLGRDAAIREMQEGGKVISFTVAVNGRYRGVEKTSWYDVSTFNYERYKNMVKYFTKGSSVIVVGDVDTDVEEGRDGITRCRRSITADSIEFNSNGVSGNTSSNTATETAETAPRKKEVEEVPQDDEIEVTRAPKKSTKKAAAEPEEAPAKTKAAVDEDASADGDDSDDLPF